MSAKSTINLYYWQEPAGDPCTNHVKWKIKTEHGNIYKVCDEHLAWGLRFSGLPAYVDEFPKEDTGQAKVQVKETKKK